MVASENAYIEFLDHSIQFQLVPAKHPNSFSMVLSETDRQRFEEMFKEDGVYRSRPPRRQKRREHKRRSRSNR
jgi:hypothetical protein